jgi:hypothetical protein
VRLLWSWNKTAVVVAGGLTYGATRTGHFAVFLLVIAGMIAATAAAIAVITWRVGPCAPDPLTSRLTPEDAELLAEEHERVAASIAALRSLRAAA